jgi:hypothetical protein
LLDPAIDERKVPDPKSEPIIMPRRQRGSRRLSVVFRAGKCISMSVTRGNFRREEKLEAHAAQLSCSLGVPSLPKVVMLAQCRPHHSFPPAPESTGVRRWTQKVRSALQRAPCNRKSRPCERNLLPQKSRKEDYPLLISNPRCGRWSTRARQLQFPAQRTFTIQTQRTSAEIRTSNSNSCIRSGQLKERNSSVLDLVLDSTNSSWVESSSLR